MSLSRRDVVKYRFCNRRIFPLVVQRSKRKKHVHSKEEIDFKTLLRIKWPGTAVGKRKTFTREAEHIVV